MVVKMTQDFVLEIFQEALMLSYKLALPLLLIGMIVGLIIAIFQAATQIHEQTLTFVPKAVVVSLMMILLGSWMLNEIIDFMHRIFNVMAGL